MMYIFISLAFRLMESCYALFFMLIKHSFLHLEMLLGILCMLALQIFLLAFVMEMGLVVVNWLDGYRLYMINY